LSRGTSGRAGPRWDNGLCHAKRGLRGSNSLADLGSWRRTA
jgi:hypothetical protein